MSEHMKRRDFLTSAAAASLGAAAAARAQGELRQPGARNRRRERRGGAARPIAIASGNGLGATERAARLLRDGADPLDAVVEGVRLVEDDPNDMSVGLGGLPNEDGVVQLDSCVMHGPMHRAGSVGALERIRNPAQVAREVARRTDHVMIVGEGALRFAKRLGFKEEDLLTKEARQAWRKWKRSLSDRDDWLERDEFDLPTSDEDDGQAHRPGAPGQAIAANPAAGPLDDPPPGWPADVPYTDGTIHCSGVTAGGDLAGCTTTSGLAWKIPGRVGDSPIIGAGCYTDNETGSAGATGRGEAVIQICGARTVVERMNAGDDPEEACLSALKHIADRTKTKRLLDSRGRPNFQVLFYALRKDGAYGSASMWSGREFAVSDGVSTRHESCAYLYERE